MSQETKSVYFPRLIAALLNRNFPVSGPEPAPTLEVPTTATEPPPVTASAAEAAQIRLDLEERNQRIASMQKEYETLEAARLRVASEASAEQEEKILKSLLRPLSNLATLMDLADSGSEVAVSDLVVLGRSLEKELARFGLERIGRTGEHTRFDPTLHQRMSGGTVAAGDDVAIAVPGFRLGPKVLTRAMVTSRAHAAPTGQGEEGQDNG